MEEEDNKKEVIEKKCNFFFNSNLIVHIKLRNGSFDNGMIKFVGTDFIKLKFLPERQREIKKDGDYIFFLEIEDIEEYFPKTRGEENGNL